MLAPRSDFGSTVEKEFRVFLLDQSIKVLYLSAVGACSGTTYEVEFSPFNFISQGFWGFKVESNEQLLQAYVEVALHEHDAKLDDETWVP